jgi:hypothetical protein
MSCLDIFNNYFLFVQLLELNHVITFPQTIMLNNLHLEGF